MNIFPIAIALVPTAYLLGSIPFGLLIVRLLTRGDIRNMGSGNIGATNVRRSVGAKWAAVTLICDGLKGILPTLVAQWIISTNWQWLPAITALAAIAGHMYPIFFGFRPGGKGVATTLGCLMIIAPWACAIAIFIFIPALYFSRRVSVGSLAATLSLPPATWFTTQDPAIGMAALVIMVLILARHRDNLRRLAQGLEPTI